MEMSDVNSETDFAARSKDIGQQQEQTAIHESKHTDSTARICEHELGVYEESDEEFTEAPDLDNSQVNEDDLLCGCCYELLVEPTTLVCGHNFCRLCLTNWFFTSKKRECPTCRQVWQGCPNVNITLRTVIQKIKAEQYQMRVAIVMDEDAKKKIAEFEKSSSPTAINNMIQRQFQQHAPQQAVPRQQGPQRQGGGNSFCSGVLFTAALLVVVYLVWYWRSSDSHLLVFKPVERWNAEDVSQWFSELGSWSSEYVVKAQEEKLDGRLLLAMDENYLQEKLNVTDSLHARAILNAISDLRARGTKRPGNLWEYKSMYPGTTLLMLYGLKDFPRAMLVYLYVFEYDTIYLPLVHWSCPRTDVERLNTTVFDNPTTEQQISCLSKWLCIPYWLFMVIAYDWTTSHYWVSRAVVANCITLTLLEGMGCLWFFKGGYKQMRSLLKGYATGLFSCVCVAIIWPIIPSFICDGFFYMALYMSPFFNWEKLYKAWKHPQQRAL